MLTSPSQLVFCFKFITDNDIASSSTADVLEAAKCAGQELARWLEQSRKLGGLTKKSYFLPIPVALVAVLP